MQHYIITGASGHIGNNLVRLINKLEPQAKVTVLTRRQITHELDGAVCTQQIGNLQDPTFLARFIKKDTIVVHLACLIDLTNKKKEESFAINFEMTKKICDLCIKNKVKRFIYVGSVDAIYRTGKEEEICEPEDYYPDKVEGNYGISKAMATKYVLTKIKENKDFNCAIAIPTAVIGINDYKPSAAGKILVNTLKGKMQAGMKGGYNFVDVEDVSNAIYTLANNNLREQYILSGTSVSVKELYQFVNKYKSLKKKPVIFPTWLVKLCVPFVKVLNKITVKALLSPHNYSCRRAAKDFNYAPKPIDETLKITVDWLENYYVKNNKT
ncbi:MAG: NAD-dependent epimerase/dehydratase family protein [Clostridia bacterium]|nr:NAD-dependent epimerase/dehydratase family protein [Clostridia bacterium]